MIDGLALLMGLLKDAQSISWKKTGCGKAYGASSLTVANLTAPLILFAVSLGLASCSGGPTRTVSPKASYLSRSKATSLERSQLLYIQQSHRSSILKANPSNRRHASRIPLGGGVRKVGKPYKIRGRWYTPKHQPNYDRIGVASWYGRQFHGKKTANGEVFDMNNLTAAHPTLPIPSHIRVTNLANGRSLILRVNDRGPYAHNRIMDLSRKSAELLGTKTRGTGRVRVQYLGPAPISGDLSREHTYLVRQPWYRTRYSKPNAKSSGFNMFSLGGPPRH